MSILPTSYSILPRSLIAHSEQLLPASHATGVMTPAAKRSKYRKQGILQKHAICN